MKPYFFYKYSLKPNSLLHKITKTNSKKTKKIAQRDDLCAIVFFFF
jgi:hypothetical protein